MLPRPRWPTLRLRNLLITAMLGILLPIIALQAWFSYQTAHTSSQQFQTQLASEVSNHLFDKVFSFFAVPYRVLHYNTELFRSNTLDINNSAALQANFLMQLRQQPLLTFLSVGTAGGDYFAASRPPLGRDRQLRLLEARSTNGRTIQLFRTTAHNQRGKLISQGNRHFDARTRPWFRSAANQPRARWYPAYRYMINDAPGAYNTLGIGMAAPLRNAANRFIGVITADVALDQLNKLLADSTRELGGSAFLIDEQGYLLATSGQQPLYRLAGTQVVRTKASSSDDALIRTASQHIITSGQLNGRSQHTIAGQQYLLDWRRYSLPDGPTLTIANALPQSRFAAPTRQLFANLALLTLAITLGALLLALSVSRWVAGPLINLQHWASLLGRGKSAPARRLPSPVAEVETLSDTLYVMAEQVRHHTTLLEQEVAARTAELEQANRALARRSDTDGLTGIANRRRFDEELDRRWLHACDHAQPLTLILLDVDRFKQYNDLFGHLAGDHCLISVAQALEASTRRNTDLVARYGGEEFAILSECTSHTQAQALAEQLRRAIEQLALPHPQHQPHAMVTASFGVAILIPTPQGNASQLIALADRALYQAKHHGRNQVATAIHCD